MPSQKKMDAIALLKEDHRKVEDLFDQFEKAREADRKEKLVKQICTCALTPEQKQDTAEAALKEFGLLGPDDRGRLTYVREERADVHRN